MIASEQEKVLGILDLIGEHEADGLNGLFSPVDVVPQEEVVGLSGKSGILEQLDEVRILTVDVT